MKPSTTATSRKATVPAVARAARLLDVLSAAKEPQPLFALAKTLALPKSTVHGLCVTLVEAGLLTRFDNGSYHLGVRIRDLAHAYLARTDLTAEFTKLVTSEGPLPEESIVLSVLDRADIVYVACRNGSRPFGFNFRIGMRLPANCAASGKALLSTFPQEHIRELARAQAFVALTPKSVTAAGPLLKQLAAVQKQGYAVDNEETRHGMVCIGAPVYSGASAQAVAALGISLPKAGLDARRKARIVDTITQLGASLSARLGASARECPSGKRA